MESIHNANIIKDIDMAINFYYSENNKLPDESYNLLKMPVDKEGLYSEKGIYQLGEKLPSNFKIGKVENQPRYKFFKYNKSIVYRKIDKGYLLYLTPHFSKGKYYYATSFNRGQRGTGNWVHIRRLRKKIEEKHKKNGEG